jgi:hypothetical protein
VSWASAVAIGAPAPTSPGKGTPVCTREYATTAASPRSGIAAEGSTSPTPVANQKAAAEWPEGNYVVEGTRT